MKKDLTEIVIVLDESGSMGSCKSDTIGGFNEFIKTQAKIKGEANVTLVKFSDYYKVINDGVDINHVALLNDENYTPSFSTALLDAVGKTINSVGKRLADTLESQRPEKVIVAIITDGFENASTEFTRKQVFGMVKHQKEKYGWEFLFLGADIDAWGEEIGIRSNVNISKDDMRGSFNTMSYFTANYRTASADLSLDNFNESQEVIEEKMKSMSKKDTNTK